MHALYADADNLRYWPANYALWAVEDRKSRRVDVGAKAGPSATAGWYRDAGKASYVTA